MGEAASRAEAGTDDHASVGYWARLAGRQRPADQFSTSVWERATLSIDAPTALIGLREAESAMTVLLTLPSIPGMHDRPETGGRGNGPGGPRQRARGTAATGPGGRGHASGSACLPAAYEWQ